MRAWEWQEHGWKQKGSAKALGITEGAVSHWLNDAREQGRDALRHQPPPGAHPQWSPHQRAQLPGLVAKGAPFFGCREEVWTTASMAQMIQQECGVNSHRTPGRRLLRSRTQRRHKPLHKATHRDDAAIQR
jgi:transposase